MFFPVQSIGFLLAGLGIVAMLAHKQDGGKVCAVAAPAVYSGTFLFVGLMVAGLGCMMAGLSVLSARAKKKGAIVLFAVAFVCCLCMGYLSTRDFTQAALNWAAEGINVLGQAALLLGTLSLHKAAPARSADS